MFRTFAKAVPKSEQGSSNNTQTLLSLLRIFAVGHWQEKKEDNVKSPGQQEAYNSPLRVLTAIFP